MNVLKKIFVIGVGIWGMATVAMAQTDRQLIREGNRHYFKQEYAKAETAYRKALSQNNANAQAAYNLGCALQMQQKDSAAIEQYQQAGKMESIKKRKAKAYHNIGVICQGHQMFAEAIEAYKESLRNNPADNETRYNLALCMRQQKNQQNGNDKKQQDKDKEKKDDNKKQQDKEKQQQMCLTSQFNLLEVESAFFLLSFTVRGWKENRESYIEKGPVENEQRGILC